MPVVMEPFVYRLGAEVPRYVIFVAVHHSVKILPDRVFFGRRQLKEVTLSEGLEEIGEAAFAGCESLEQINYPSTLIKIGIGAFVGCRSLKEVELLEGLEEIGNSAFAGCKSLERNNYPSTLIKIGHRSFLDCQSLKEVQLPEGLKEIGEETFSRCRLLERINCPSTLIKICNRAFDRCSRLTTVKLMGGIVTIEENAFSRCALLEEVTILSNAFVLDGVTNFNTQLVSQSLDITYAQQMIISTERLNYISLHDLLELQSENTITTIMNDRGHTREENIEQVLALIKSHALIEVSIILELALWKNKMDETDDSNAGSRRECRVMCGADGIIPCVLSYL